MNPKDKLAASRLMARERMPYMRAAIMALIPREVKGLGTFGVAKNGVMLWDPAALERWSVEEAAGVVVHEALHLLRAHSDRAEAMKADPTIWNCAADLEINDDLIAARMKLPEGGLLPEKYGLDDGMAAEEYYRILEQAAQKLSEMLAAAGLDEEGQPLEDGSAKGKAAAGRCGTGAGGNALPGEDEASKEGTAGRSEVHLDRMRRQVAEDVQQEAQRGRGTVPAGLARWADQALKPPKIPWRQKLARAVRGAVAYRPGAVDMHWNRISRRQSGIGYGPGRPVLPALVAPIPNIHVAIDTSGSMGAEELETAVSETNGVLAATGSNVTFYACDAEVHTAREVRNWQDVVANLKGGGGTSFVPVFETIAARRQRPDVLIFVTDGCGDAPAEPPPYKVIWVLVGPYKQKPAAGSWGGDAVSYGEFIEIDDAEEQAA